MSELMASFEQALTSSSSTSLHNSLTDLEFKMLGQVVDASDFQNDANHVQGDEDDLGPSLATAGDLAHEST